MRNIKDGAFWLNLLNIILIAAQLAAIIFLCLFIPNRLPAVVALTGTWALSAVSAVLLFFRQGGPEIKCVWLLLIAALPVVGAVVCLITCRKGISYGVLTVEGSGGSGIAKAAKTLCGTGEAGYDSADYYKSGAEFFKAAANAIECARHRVYIEFYIISRGFILQSFICALEKAKESGAEIKIIFDGLGSAFRIGRKEIKRLKALGEVKIFHRITPFSGRRLNFRDHRKIIAIDGHTAFTGGFNVGDEYAGITSPHGHWKDCGVKVCGGAAEVLEGMFLALWQGEYKMNAPSGGKYRCVPYYDSPSARRFYGEAAAYAISSATQRVHILTPYLSLGEKIFDALAFAARRGVEVKIIIPHVPDKKVVLELSKEYAARLIRAGAQCFEYTPGFMHAKCLICDDNAFLGSHNLDFRSAHFNFECGILFGEEMCVQAEADFQECLEKSAPLDGKKPKPLRRLLRKFLKLFAPLM